MTNYDIEFDKKLDRIEQYHEIETGIKLVNELDNELPYCLHDDSGLVARCKTRRIRANLIEHYHRFLNRAFGGNGEVNYNDR